MQILLLALLGYLFYRYVYPYFTDRYQTIDDKFNERRAAQQKELDRILDKISNTGIDSLSKNEKETLERMSKR
jgi:hypothetical protein